MPKPSFVAAEDTRTYIRWDRPLYLQLYAAARPLIDQGIEFIDALAAAQSHLPPDKQRDAEGLERIISHSPQMADAIEEYQRLTPSCRADLVHRLKQYGDVVEAHPDGTRIHWDDREEALIDRRVLYMRITLGDQRMVWSRGSSMRCASNCPGTAGAPSSR